MDCWRGCRGGLAVVLALGAVSMIRADDTPKATVGKLAVVIPASPRGLNYFPDEQISFLGRNPRRFPVVAGNATVLMQGQTVAGAAPQQTVLEPGKKTDADPVCN